MKKIILGIGIFIVFVLLGCSFLYIYLKGAPDKNSTDEVIFTVTEGESFSTIGSSLEKEGLIRSNIMFKIFVKILNPGTLELGDYKLSKSYDLNKTIELLKEGSVETREITTVTFVEGKNFRYYMSILNEEFGFTEEDMLNKISDSEYLDSLIDKYWFLTDDIKNSKIYYSLEGYLYPDTYQFYKDSTIEEVFETILNNTLNKLNSYKESIENSEYSIHEIITLSSIIEIEASSADDRSGVAGVFYNRLKSGWSLGSDVTTYYASKVELWSRDLKQSEINSCNDYNTRNSCMAGKLPVGPVSNPSIKSIEACISPTSHNYYYFVADKNGKTYFNETFSGHSKTVSKLKKEGLWYEY